jgi:hypothetical protein
MIAPRLLRRRAVRRSGPTTGKLRTGECSQRSEPRVDNDRPLLIVREDHFGQENAYRQAGYRSDYPAEPNHCRQSVGLWRCIDNRFLNGRERSQ